MQAIRDARWLFWGRAVLLVSDLSSLPAGMLLESNQEKPLGTLQIVRSTKETIMSATPFRAWVLALASERAVKLPPNQNGLKTSIQGNINAGVRRE